MVFDSKKCANCPSYKWPQLDNLAVYKRCAGCKILYYCSQECQVEHWHKVHKFHCKYLSGKKEKKNSKHDPKKCKFCCNADKMGDKAIESSDIGVLGCPVRKDIVSSLLFNQGQSSEAPTPVQSGEMTGVFPSFLEHTLYSMLRILNKILYVNKYQFNDLQEIRWKLVVEVSDLRMYVRHNYCYLTAREIDLLELPLDRVAPLVKTFNDILCRKGLDMQDSLRLMDTFVTLCQLLFSVISRNVEISSSFVSGIYYEFSETDIKNKWTKILEALDSDEWTYKKLLAILLPNDMTYHNCFGCGEVVEAEYFRYFEVWCDDSKPGFVEGSIYFVSTIFPIGFFICQVYERSECLMKLMNFYSANTVFKPFNTPNTIMYEYHESSLMYRCDNCFKFAAKVHRCSKCLTKLYCGEDCRDEDWSIHQLVCVKDKRKKKDNGSVRFRNTVENDEERFSKYMKSLAQLIQEKSGMF